MTVVSPEERIGILEANQSDIRADVHEIRGDIREIRSDLAARPTWGVAKMLAFLGSLAATLGTATLALILHITVT
jgi:hypothetical protein